MEQAPLLGDYALPRISFPQLDALFAEFGKDSFLALKENERRDRLNEALYQLIDREKSPCFLLPAVLAFIEQVEKKGLLPRYTFASFELWLNQYSGLSFEKNYETRGKIAGKWVERGSFQTLFPIGMDKVYEGTHIVTAHKSPDLDTTIASFWGWLDAFTARVGTGVHLWNLPGGPPPSQIEIELIFRDVFGEALFSQLAKKRTTLNLTARDLMSQESLLAVTLDDSIAAIDHGRAQRAVVIVDEQGGYLGDWKEIDVEGVGQLITYLGSFVRWFEHQLSVKWVFLFAQENLRFSQVEPALQELFATKLQDAEPALHLLPKHKENLAQLIVQVIGAKEGLALSFEMLFSFLSQLSQLTSPFFSAKEVSKELYPLFANKETLTSDNKEIFQFLERSLETLHGVILKIRQRLAKLDVALKIKEGVFAAHPVAVTLRTDVEEVRSRMGSSHFLTVVHADGGKNVPVAGVIPAARLRMPTLGTVSLRDFCNRDEMGIPPYLEVISVIDHHKSKLQTQAPPFAFIADVQSSNTLVAFCAFEINDRYSGRGQNAEGMKKQLKEIEGKENEQVELFQRLWKKGKALFSPTAFFIDSNREFLEYLHFLYAIFDDTDLLSKASSPDLECVAELVNRLKSLQLQKETIEISLSDLPRDKEFLKKAADRILRNPEVYSLYRKVYHFREQEVEKNVKLAFEGKVSNLFADTKEQNGCCRVGQTKLFAKNIPAFLEYADKIREVWLKGAEDCYREKEEIDLHLHMISTIVSAEEVFQEKETTYSHKDELWIWIPESDVAVEHLQSFLHAFQKSKGLQNSPMEVEFLGENAEFLAHIFQQSFLPMPQKISKKGLNLAVLRFAPGRLNSRKAMVSPFLPTLY